MRPTSGAYRPGGAAPKSQTGSSRRAEGPTERLEGTRPLAGERLLRKLGPTKDASRRNPSLESVTGTSHQAPPFDGSRYEHPLPLPPTSSARNPGLRPPCGDLPPSLDRPRRARRRNPDLLRGLLVYRVLLHAAGHPGQLPPTPFGIERRHHPPTRISLRRPPVEAWTSDEPGRRIPTPAAHEERGGMHEMMLRLGWPSPRPSVTVGPLRREPPEVGIPKAPIFSRYACT